MKTTFFTTTLILMFTSSVVLASDKDAKSVKDTKASTAAVTKDQPKPKEKPAPRQEKVALTGSYIKRDVRRNGQITDGPSPVAVLDSKAIQNSGAADLRQLLVRGGLHH